MIDIYGIICVDKDEFDALNLHITRWLRRRQKAKMARWSKIIRHPEDNRIALLVKMDRIQNALTKAQKRRVVPLGEDWFKQTEIL